MIRFKSAFVAATVVLFLAVTPFSWAQRRNQAQAVPAAQPQAPASPQLFTGDGGRGVSLAVLVPEARGLAAEQNYLPTLVQGVLVGDLAKFSAISVLDRMRLETVLRETESGIYSSEEDFGRLGEIANVDYVLTGSITRTGTGYAMQIQVVGTGSGNIGITRASYSGTPTIAEMDNFTGIRRASLELLTQMGVNLTDMARQELTGAGASSYVSAQTALAQGIVAQNAGNTIEMMARFYEAAAYDPAFAEAANRANTMSASIRTGSMGDNIRNDIAWRDEWVKILADATQFLQANPPVVAQVVYNPELTQGATDFNRRTAEFSFTAQIIDNIPYPPALLRVMNDLNEGLNATGRNSVWRLNPLTPWNVWGVNHGLVRIIIQAELVNQNGRVIGRNTLMARGVIGAGYGHIGDGVKMSFGETRNIFLAIPEDNRISINRQIRFNVAADDITDHITINLTATADGSINFTDGRTGNREFPIQVMTTTEYHTFLTNTGGLPPMETRQITFQPQREVTQGRGNNRRTLTESDPRREQKQLTIEIPGNANERNLHLSFRPGLADGNGFRLLLSSGAYIDTTHYQFPVSAAVLFFDRTRRGIRQIIDIEPGNRVQITTNSADNTVIIVPKGWFNRNNIRVGDLVSGLDRSPSPGR